MPRTLSRVLVLFITATTWGCGGPDIDDAFALRQGDAALTKGLRTTYRSELDAAFGKGPKREVSYDYYDSNQGALDVISDVMGLLDKAMRAEARANAAERVRLIASQIAFRTLSANERSAGMSYLYYDKAGMPRITHDSGYPKQMKVPEGGRDMVQVDSYDPDKVKAALEKAPREFQLYIQSLNTSRENQLAMTERLLALPASERPNLTALAHYRRARLQTLMADWEKLDDEEIRARLRAIRGDYEQALEAVRQGAPDIDGLRAKSIGWLAHSRSLILPLGQLGELGEADFGGALRAYLQLRTEGDIMGEQSAYLLIRLLAAEPQTHAICARDKDLRKLMTIFLCTGGNRAIGDELDDGEAAARGWLELLKEAKVDPAEDATRIALLQYNTGNYAACEATLALCATEDPAAALLRSRILIRKGRTAEAAAALRAAESALTDQPWTANWDDNGTHIHVDRSRADSVGGKVRSDLAAFALSQGDYSEAFRLNAVAGLDRDMRYVGECVMTIEELKLVVDRDWSRKREVREWWDGKPHDLSVEIRNLLARRLCRAGRWSEALPYLTDSLGEALRNHIQLMAAAANPKSERRTRADAYWRSAALMQRHGEELIFCDFGERWSVYGGWKLREWPACRIRGTETMPLSRLAPPSADEVRRVEAWMAANLNPPYRGHRVMKYEALRLGLKAVELLPNNDPAGGMILQCVGAQLMHIDPPEANKAYKLLATRFKETPFGKHAAEKRWFMRLEEPLEPNAEWVSNPRTAIYTPPAPKPETDDEGK